MKAPLLLVYSEDDPVDPMGCSQCWLDTFERSENTACAMFRIGSHLACYDSVTLQTRWCDKLAVEWIDALESSTKVAKVGC